MPDAARLHLQARPATLSAMVWHARCWHCLAGGSWLNRWPMLCTSLCQAWHISAPRPSQAPRSRAQAARRMALSRHALCSTHGMSRNLGLIAHAPSRSLQTLSSEAAYGSWQCLSVPMWLREGSIANFRTQVLGLAHASPVDHKFSWRPSLRQMLGCQSTVQSKTCQCQLATR